MKSFSIRRKWPIICLTVLVIVAIDREKLNALKVQIILDTIEKQHGYICPSPETDQQGTAPIHDPTKNTHYGTKSDRSWRNIG